MIKYYFNTEHCLCRRKKVVAKKSDSECHVSHDITFIFIFLIKGVYEFY